MLFSPLQRDEWALSARPIASVSYLIQSMHGILCVGIAYTISEFTRMDFFVGKFENQLSNFRCRKFRTPKNAVTYKTYDGTIKWKFNTSRVSRSLVRDDSRFFSLVLFSPIQHDECAISITNASFTRPSASVSYLIQSM